MLFIGKRWEHAEEQYCANRTSSAIGSNNRKNNINITYYMCYIQYVFENKYLILNTVTFREYFKYFIQVIFPKLY